MAQQKAPSESLEAKTLATYLNALVKYNQIICYTKTAQETFSASWGAKMRQKAEGVQKGIPDYVIFTKKGIIFLELKKRLGTRGGMSGSKISQEQQVWVDTANSYNSPSIVAGFCFGADDAIKFVKRNL